MNVIGLARSQRRKEIQMEQMKYFGDYMKKGDKTLLKEINEDIKSKNPEYIFQKPPSNISIKWNLEDWMNWIDWCETKESK
jgi:hypothetical protein